MLCVCVSFFKLQSIFIDFNWYHLITDQIEWISSLAKTAEYINYSKKRKWKIIKLKYIWLVYFYFIFY